MDLTPYIASLREDLVTAASAGDENTRRTAEVLAAALEPAARLAIMNALSDLAAEVTASLDDHVVDVRLAGRDVQVVVTGRGTPHDDSRAGDVPPVDETAGGDMSRMTLRLFEQLKAKAEQAAAAQGVSLNTFVQQAVQGALHRKGGFGGKDWSREWSRAWGSGGPERGQSQHRVHGWYEG
ncbi:toxin-antitoxin system HicB family antitoxin [Actinophytocola sp.]|jgi:HicB-like protein involved in pilus formation|uniref:toxin-antitoxin system HicB family antitoxin n=1 Tax=Actinophytocola sp. TaxID=1872138 RepID=UPI002D6F1D03|nr:toxin-antitoxin system HicB family antitoxin [Actinophytocola sp.]HYQ65860.1 toxin-antitoxin system HicB family antitoxin [Actinophytocola sp.]